MRRILAVSLFALAGTAGVHAQAVLASGAITGLVKDIYGDGIPETTVTLTNKVVGLKRAMLTSDDGLFEMVSLIPAGSYDLKVTRRGYADWELPNFDLSLGETLNFKITLYADRAPTPDEAQRSLHAVQDTKTSLSTLVDDEQLYALPTQNLRLDPFVLLAPTAVAGPDGTIAFHGEAYRNVFYFDGISTTNNYFFHTPGIAPFIMAESSSELQVIAQGAPAEFGHTAGGIVNTVSKSGINSLHASAYDYYAQNSWNAPDFFGNGFTPAGRLNHGGVSVGLPIATDELFLFGNLERVNETSEGLNRITNPLLTTNGGNSVNSANCTATALQCSTAAIFLNQQMNVKVPQSQISTIGFARMDFRPGDRNAFTLAGDIMSQRAPNSLDNATVAPNGGLLGMNATTTESTRYATASWTRVINAFTMNELRGDWFRDTLTASTDPTLFPQSSTACPSCGTGPLAISVAGTLLGGNPSIPFNLREQRYGGTDIFTHQVGTNTVRGGADIWRNQDTNDQLYSRYGMYNYPSLSAFANDFSNNTKQVKSYSTFIQTLGNPVTDLTSYQFHIFVEDTWRPRPGLSISGGVRWEKARLPQPTEPNPGNFQSEFIPSPNTNFSPRIGIAYLLDNRTVIRVGGGSNYEPFPGQFIRDLFTGGGIYQSYYILTPNEVGSPVFPKALAPNATSTLASPLLSEFYTAAKFRNPYALQGSAGIERRLTRYISVVASYVQSQSNRLFSATDVDVEGSANTSETYTINNAQGTSTGTYTTQVFNGSTAGQRFQVDNEAGARYRAGTVQFRTAPFLGLSVQASYTWSHAYDDISGPPAYSIVPSNYFPGSYYGDWGPSAFDQRNHAVVNWVWRPTVKGTDALSRFVINGWMVAGIATYGSSMYVTPVIDVIGQQFPKATGVAGITMDYTTSLNGSGGWNRNPLQKVNSLPLGSIVNVDIRASKTIPFTGRLKGQFIVQAFNVANRNNVSAVNTTAYTATLGVLTPVPGLGAPIASYGFPYGSSARRLQIGIRLEF